MQIEEQSLTQQSRTTLSDSFLIRHYCLMIYNFYKWYIVPMTRIAPCKYIFKNINLGGWRPVFCVFFSFWKDLVSFACKITQNIYFDSKLLTKNRPDGRAEKVTEFLFSQVASSSPATVKNLLIIIIQRIFKLRLNTKN